VSENRDDETTNDSADFPKGFGVDESMNRICEMRTKASYKVREATFQYMGHEIQLFKDGDGY
jgi:hypothetical protein